MPDQIQKSDIIKWLVRTLISIAVAFVVFAYGMLVGRIDNTEMVAHDAQTRVSVVEGDIKEIRKSVEWLEKVRTEYIQANGQFNMGEFLKELFSKQ